MVNAGDASQDPAAESTERKEVQQDWILASSEYSRRARQALSKASQVLEDTVPGHPPDGELAGAWAAVGQGWATLSHAEAARCIAIAAIAIDESGLPSQVGQPTREVLGSTLCAVDLTS